MFEHETFRNAPITEAAVDFSVDFADPPGRNTLARFGEAAAHLFPTSRERRMFTTSLEMVDDEPIFHNTEHRFLAFSSDDGKYIAQVRSDGFGFSRLKPYTSWSDFSARALEGWSIYNQVFTPQRLSGISLKYVNRVELPMPLDFDEYFYTNIKLAPEIPQAVFEAFFAFALHDENNNIGRVVFTIDRSGSTKEQTSVVFNVEAALDRDKMLTIGFEQVPQILATLRDLKNRLFFCSITERMKRTFR
jgi:uncharacterized protein (TIGR04255 family)